MHNSQNKKTLQIVLIVLVAVLTLGIGYASLSAINLIIDGNATANPNDNNFKVKFLYEKDVTPMIEGSPTNTVQVDSDTTASFNVSTLNGAGQSVTATYRVKNESPGIGASIGLQLTNSNPDYFQVTQKILDNKLQAGEETTVTVKVEMLKTPVTAATSTSITATLIATPIEDAEASGGDPQEIVNPVPYLYIASGYNETYMNANNKFNTNIRTYSNFAAIKSEYGHPAAIAIKLDNDTVIESYVVFEKNDKLYYLIRPVENETTIYNKNVSILEEAFESELQSKCNYNENGSVSCHTDDYYVEVSKSGTVVSGHASWTCTAWTDGRIGCWNY